MSIDTLKDVMEKTVVSVGMGNIAILTDDNVGRAVLGSCVGAVLYSESAKTAALAHIVLPQDKMGTETPGKFADTAIPEMIRQLQALKILPTNLVAKLAGGASMFATQGGMEIGKSNCEMVTSILGQRKIKIVGQDFGGKKGRKIVFDPSSGEMRVEKAGEDPLFV